MDYDLALTFYVLMLTIETYFILMMIRMSWICGKRHGRQKLAAKLPNK